MMAPPRSRWRSAVPDAIPARLRPAPIRSASATPACPRSRRRSRRTRSRARPSSTRCPPSTAAASSGSRAGRRRSRSSSVNRAPRASTSFAERGAISTMKNAAGRIAAPASSVSIAEHVLQELLADEHRAHQRAEHDDARAGGDPEDRGGRRRRGRRAGSRPALPDHERDAAPASAIDREAEHERSLVGTGAKLIASTSAATSTTDRIAAEVVDRLGRLVDVARHEPDRQDERDDRERQRDEEHRAPPEVLEQRAGEQRAERRRSRRRCADHSAIDFVRGCPDHSAVMSASVVGYAMPAESAADDAGDERGPRRSAPTPPADTREPTAPRRGSSIILRP